MPNKLGSAMFDEGRAKLVLDLQNDIYQLQREDEAAVVGYYISMIGSHIPTANTAMYCTNMVYFLQHDIKGNTVLSDVLKEKLSSLAGVVGLDHIKFIQGIEEHAYKRTLM